jgi:hypothetical protein
MVKRPCWCLGLLSARDVCKRWCLRGGVRVDGMSMAVLDCCWAGFLELGGYGDGMGWDGMGGGSDMG